jgi:hypothetical protein
MNCPVLGTLQNFRDRTVTFISVEHLVSESFQFETGNDLLAVQTAALFATNLAADLNAAYTGTLTSPCVADCSRSENIILDNQDSPILSYLDWSPHTRQFAPQKEGAGDHFSSIYGAIRVEIIPNCSGSIYRPFCYWASRIPQDGCAMSARILRAREALPPASSAAPC